MLPGGPWTLGVAILLLVVAGAKAHGRQVRLERERIGVHEVQFGKANDPRVEAIWRRDRRGFWALFAVLVAAAWALVVAGIRVAGSGAMASAGLLLALAFALCFVVLGAASLARLVPTRDRDDAAWKRRALIESLYWWLLVAAALVLVGLSL